MTSLRSSPAKQFLSGLDQFMASRARAEVIVLAVCGVLMIGAIDYLTGYETSMSLFYLAPVAAAAWYSRGGGYIAVALFACVVWFLADGAAGSHYSHPAIPGWNALVRLGFFLITGLLLAALRESFLVQQSLARIDSLTGLDNRGALMDRLAHDLALARRYGSALTLAYLDVDDFKAVNDAGGHAEGDRVLALIGEALRGSVREADTAARLGGDEFALILPNTDADDATHTIAHLVGGLRCVVGPDGRQVTCSIGVVTFLDSSISPRQALAAADAIMYQVKRATKGTVLFSLVDETGHHGPHPSAGG